MDPMEVLANIEDKLQIECTPLSWPIGMGKDFKGVYNLYRKGVSASSWRSGPVFNSARPGNITDPPPHT
jgi:peptide chain release factor 3